MTENAKDSTDSGTSSGVSLKTLKGCDPSGGDKVPGLVGRGEKGRFAESVAPFLVQAAPNPPHKKLFSMTYLVSSALFFMFNFLRMWAR
jgi:hypothetical protein